MDGGGITPGGGSGAIGGACGLTGIITSGTADGTGDTVNTSGAVGSTGGTKRRWRLMFGGAVSFCTSLAPTFGAAAMIGARSTSHVTFRVLLTLSCPVTTLTQSRGWPRPRLR